MYNERKLIGIMLTGLILVNLTGCRNNDGKITDQVQSSVNDNITDSLLNESTIPNLTEEKNTESSTNTPENQEQNNETIPNDITYVEENLNKDEIVINYFNSATEDINNLLSSENVTSAKEKCKEYFITFVDFIFYDGTIKNITFDELKAETKKQVINITQKLDALIMTKFPTYKETISETSKSLYDKASDLLNSGKENLEDYIISKVGDDKYQDALDSINEIKEKDKETLNDIKDVTSGIYETGKEKIKNWYENFKNN